MPRYVTVVFEIEDKESFQPMSAMLKELMTNAINKKNNNYCVVFMSTDNEIGRVDLIEQVLNSNEYSEYEKANIIKEIVDTMDIGNKKLKEVIEE